MYRLRAGSSRITNGRGNIAAGLNYLLQSSDSLDAEWLTIDSPNEVTSPTSDPAIVKVQVTVPIESEEPNKFYRIQVIPE